MLAVSSAFALGRQDDAEQLYCNIAVARRLQAESNMRVCLQSEAEGRGPTLNSSGLRDRLSSEIGPSRLLFPIPSHVLQPFLYSERCWNLERLFWSSFWRAI